MGIDIDRYLHEELSADLLKERATDRRQAIIVLARLGRGEETLETLRYLADTDPDSDTRALARAKYAELWERIGKEGVADVAVMAGDPPALDIEAVERHQASASAVVRLEALVQAMKANDSRLLTLALARLDVETDDWVLATLIRAIGRLGSAIHVPRIQRFLNHHSSSRVVANTVEAIASLDPEAGFTLLVPLLSADDSRVRSCAIGAMITVEKEAALGTLVAMSKGPRATTRDAAIHCLNKLEEPEAEKILTDMLLVETEAPLVPRILEALAKKATRSTLVRLAPIVAREPNRAHRDAIAQLVRDVVARLGTPQAELDEMGKGPLPEPPPPPESPALRRATRKTRSVVAAPPPPPPPRSRAIPLAITATLLSIGICVLLWYREQAQNGPLGRRAISATALSTVATAPSPGRFLNQVVRWEGVVEAVDVASSSVRLRGGRMTFSATLDRRATRSFKRGDRLRVVGRVVGRSRLGPGSLQGSRVETL
jgi:HEAT repeat protein